jgi:ATP-dependent Clp protease ATP-binding subunit ClpA
LIARLDEILFFNKLNDTHLLKIVDQELKNIAERLADRGVALKYDFSVKKHIFNKIKEKNNHARHIKNLVKSTVQVPLSEFIVKNRKTEKISLKVVDKSLAFV